MQDAQEPAKQSVHVLITTYTEPVETVRCAPGSAFCILYCQFTGLISGYTSATSTVFRECVIRCLVAPEPSYMEKNIFVCDDGHAKTDGPKKRAMVEELRILGTFLPCEKLKRNKLLDHANQA